ncbi:MAG TPA: hypothetical protein VI251_08285 [Pseudolabrys sp.]
MLGLYRITKFGLVILAAAVMLAASPAPSRADTGTVRATVTRGGFIVGVGGGTGVLRFHGRSYPFRIGGMSFGATIGASSTDLIGRAYNLRTASDLVGTYTSIGAGVAVAGGAGSVRLQNAKGVVLELRGRRVGFEFSVAMGGVEISMR